MKKLITKQELENSYPKTPKMFKLRKWASTYLSLQLVSLIAFFVVTPLALNDNATKNEEFFPIVASIFLLMVIISLFMSFAICGLGSGGSTVGFQFGFIARLFKIKRTLQEISEWEEKLREYFRQQEYLKLKQEYEPTKEEEL